MKSNDDLVAAVLMVKNEEKDIEMTINCFKDHIKHVAIFDTGSTDRTVEIIKRTCTKNKQVLYLKEGTFTNFPVSRNEFFDYIDENVPCKFLILIDASDEFKCLKNKQQFLKDLTKIPNSVNYGLVQHKWIEQGQKRMHADIRFVRNKAGCRYDPDTPVHVRFQNIKETPISMSELFYLFQDREKHGGSTKQRLYKDIEEFEKAKKTKRNYYFLGQTYMNLEGEWKNALKYNLLAYDTPETDEISSVDPRLMCCRIMYCSIMCQMPFKFIYKYFEEVHKYPEPPIDAYIFLFRSSIDHKCTDYAVPHIITLFNYQKPTDDNTAVVEDFFDYNRWNLISIVCLISGKHLNIGKEACLRAVNARHIQDDIHNLTVYNQIM